MVLNFIRLFFRRYSALSISLILMLLLTSWQWMSRYSRVVKLASVLDEAYHVTNASSILTWYLFLFIILIAAVRFVKSLFLDGILFFVRPMLAFKRTMVAHATIARHTLYSLSGRDRKRSAAVLVSLENRVKQHWLGLVAITYSLTRARDWKDVASEIVKLFSFMNIATDKVNNIIDPFQCIDKVKVGEQQSLDNAISLAGTALALTGIDINPAVSIEKITARSAYNIKNFNICWKELKAVLQSTGLMKDASYSVLLDAARDLQSMYSEFEWVKVSALTNPNELLLAAGRTRVLKLKQLADDRYNMLNLIEDKTLRTDSLYREVSMLMREIRTYMVKIEAMRRTSMYRVKPVGVCIQGKEQIGKTTLVSILSKMIGEKLEKVDSERFTGASQWTIWRRTPRDEYDTGYVGQEITYCDDAFQEKDHKDHLMWYTFISSSAVGTNQADLHLKGLPFQSRMVVTTCNQWPTHSTTVEHMPSLWARFPVSVIAQLKPGQSAPRTGKIDTSYSWLDFYYGSMDRMIGVDISHPEACGLKKLTLNELVDIIVQQLRYEETFFESTMALCANTAVQQSDNEARELLSSNTPRGSKSKLNVKIDKLQSEGVQTIQGVVPDVQELKALVEKPFKKVYHSKRTIELKVRDNITNGEPVSEIELNQFYYGKLFNTLKECVREGLPLSTIRDLDGWINFYHKVDDIEGEPLLEHIHILTDMKLDFNGVLPFISTQTTSNLEEVRMRYTNKPLIFTIGSLKAIWVPWFNNGRDIIMLTEELLKLIKMSNFTYEGMNSVSEGRHQYIEGNYNCMDEADVHEFTSVLRTARYCQFPEREQLDIVKDILNPIRSPVLAGVVRFAVRADEVNDSLPGLTQSLRSRFFRVDRFIDNIATSGLETFFSIASSLGIPISEYWQAAIMSEKSFIGATTVGLLTGTALWCVYQLLKRRSEAIEQSAGEKKANVKKVTRAIRKLDLKTAQQQYANGDCEIVEGIQPFEPDFVADDIISELQNSGTHKVMFANFTGDVALLDESYKDGVTMYAFETNEELLPLIGSNKLVVNRLPSNGENMVEINYQFVSKSSQFKEDLTNSINAIRTVYPHSMAVVDVTSSMVASDIHCSIWYEVHNALQEGTQGRPQQWTRREIARKATELAKLVGTPVKEPVKQAVVQATYDQSIDSLKSCVNKHQCAIDLVDPLQMDSQQYLATSFGLGHLDYVIFNAHLIVNKATKFIRVRNLGGVSQRKYHMARVDYIDPVRDVAIAKLVDKDTITEYLVSSKAPANLIHMETNMYRFPSLANKLLSSAASSVALAGCTTVHKLPKSNLIVRGQCNKRVVQEFQFGNNSTDSRDLVEVIISGTADIDCSKKGDCGGIVVLASGANVGKILGFHSVVLTDRTKWFIALLTSDDLICLESAVQQALYVDKFEEYISSDVAYDVPPGPCIQEVGKFKWKTLPATKTDLSHWHLSPFANEFEEQLVPGPLNPADDVISVELPTNKLGHPSLLIGPNAEMGTDISDISEADLQWIEDQLVNEQVLSIGSLATVPSDIDDVLDRSLNGYQNFVHVTGIEVNAASGLPWCYLGGALKSDWVDVNPDDGKRTFNEGNSLLRDRVVDKLVLGSQGIRLKSFTNTKLKDTTIKKQYASIGKTRVFHCVPIDVILFESALFGPYKEAYTLAGLRMHHAVGINVHSIQWHLLAEHLRKHPNYFDCDYANYDKKLGGRLLKCVFNIMRRVIQQLAPDNWDAARAVCMDEAINTFVVDVQSVYQTNRANKSGSFLTTIVNCIANDIYTIFVWLKATSIYDLGKLRQEVVSVSFGDDKIQSVSDEFKDKVNYFSTKEILQSIGHTITVGSKDGVEAATTDFENLQFLKRGFKYLPDRARFVAPLLKRSIESPLVWTTIHSYQSDVWLNLLGEQLMEAYLHGVEYFTEFINALKLCQDPRLKEYCVNVLTRSFSGVENDYWERYYGVTRRSIFPEQDLN